MHPRCHKAERQPSSPLSLQCLTKDIFPVQKGHFAHDSDPCLLQSVLGPALGSLHELGHLSKGRGARQRS